MLANSSRKIAQNDFSGEDLAVPNNDEMGELVHAVNKMKHATEGYINTLKKNSEMAELLHREELERMDMEKQLNEMGYTAGHFPQSLPLASLGGLVATRSIGQFSTLYGGIEDMVTGMEFVLADGHIVQRGDHDCGSQGRGDEESVSDVEAVLRSPAG